MIRRARLNHVVAPHFLLAGLLALTAGGCSDNASKNVPVGSGPVGSGPVASGPIATGSGSTSTRSLPAPDRLAANTSTPAPAVAEVPSSEAPPPVGTWRRYHEATGMTGEDLRAVWMNKEFNVGWAVGSGGVVLRYADGKWQRDEAASRLMPQGLARIAMSADGSEGWAIGQRDSWIQFTGGKWQLPAVKPEEEPAWDVTALALTARGDTGWAFYSGGRIAKLEKGQWKKLAETESKIVNGDFVSLPTMNKLWLSADGTQGWAVGYGATVMRLADGKWTKDEAASSLGKGTIEALAMSADGTTGWATDIDDKIFRFENGKWSVVKPDEGADLYFSPDFIALSADGKNGWAISSTGSPHRIVDGKWKKEERMTKGYLSDLVVSADAKRGVAVGGDGDIFELTDGAWKPVALPNRVTKQDLHALWMRDDGKLGFAAGRGAILKYADGVWSESFKFKNEFAFQSPEFCGVQFNAEGTAGWAVGAKLMQYEGGAWKDVGDKPKGTIQALWMSSDLKQGWAPCNGPNFLRFVDGKWSRDEAASVLIQSTPYCIWMSDDGTKGWVGCDNDLMLRFADGSWTKDEAASKLQYDAKAILVKPDGTDGWAVCGGGYVSQLRNGMWLQSKIKGCDRDLRAVAMDDKFEFGFAVGAEGEILRYAGGGWWPDGARNQISATLRAVWLKRDGSEGWSVGTNGEIWRYTRSDTAAK